MLPMSMVYGIATVDFDYGVHFQSLKLAFLLLVLYFHHFRLHSHRFQWAQLLHHLVLELLLLYYRVEMALMLDSSGIALDLVKCPILDCLAMSSI